MHARDQWKALLEEFSLYRQHQRLTNSGITLSRGTLTNLTTRVIELMKQAWFWPLMGEQDEISFTDSTGRGRVPIERVLEDWLEGTLVSDGSVTCSRYAAKNEQITRANCWVHGRRQFVEAQEGEPDAVKQVLDSIGHLYRVEAQI